MGGNYERGMYNQLMEVMARLDSVEKDYKKDVQYLNDKIDGLTQENDALRKENQLLKDVLFGTVTELLGIYNS